MKPVIKMLVARDGTLDLSRMLFNLTKKDVLVGVPASEADRPGEQINNATLAYIHDNGSPLRNIPPRPFMQPGIQNAKEDIANYLKQAGEAAIDGSSERLDRALMAAGLTAQKSIRRRIQTGPFTPLKASTVQARKRKHKGRSNNARPLIDTGAMLASINFIVRDKKK